MDRHFPTLKSDDPTAPLDSTLSFQLTLLHRKTGIKAEEKKKNDSGSG
jgi:hypothetical protein